LCLWCRSDRSYLPSSACDIAGHLDPALVAEFDRRGSAALNVLDAHLSERRFLVGGTLTIANICCYADIAFAKLTGRDFAAWPNVTAWAGRIEALPGFAEPFVLLAMQNAEIGP
jgi:glutathione S-transferase